MIDTEVKVYFPDKEFGFFYNPKGEKDIYFRIRGRHKKKSGSFVPAKTTPDSLPKPRQKAQVLELISTDQGPRATKWRLM